MSQNTSHAVMQQRSEAHDSLDDFPTPPWATRALIEHVLIPAGGGLIGRKHLRTRTCWEPCANRGFMYLPLQEYFRNVEASDIFDYGMGYPQHDFLLPFVPVWNGVSKPYAPDDEFIDWIITNPPFRLAEQIVLRARCIARQGVAVLVRSAFLEGVDRYWTLFSISPPTLVAQFAERVIMHKGVLRDPNKEYLDIATGKMKRPSTATSYTWLVWITGMDPRPTIWIPPCRRLLERQGDYPS